MSEEVLSMKNIKANINNLYRNLCKLGQLVYNDKP